MNPLAGDAKHLAHLGDPDEIKLLRHRGSLLLTCDKIRDTLTDVKSGPGGAGTPRGLASTALGGTDVAKSTGRPGAPSDYSLRFIELLDEWVTRHRCLLDALVELRGTGDGAEAAVEAILAVKIVRVLSASWELWDQLVECTGDDPDVVLLDRLPRQVVEHARMAIWGSPWRRPRLRLVLP